MTHDTGSWVSLSDALAPVLARLAAQRGAAEQPFDCARGVGTSQMRATERQRGAASGDTAPPCSGDERGGRLSPLR